MIEAIVKVIFQQNSSIQVMWSICQRYLDEVLYISIGTAIDICSLL